MIYIHIYNIYCIYIYIYIIVIVVLIFNSEVYLNIQSLPQIRKESYTEFGLCGNTCMRGGFGVSVFKTRSLCSSCRGSGFVGSKFL